VPSDGTFVNFIELLATFAEISLQLAMHVMLSVYVHGFSVVCCPLMKSLQCSLFHDLCSLLQGLSVQFALIVELIGTAADLNEQGWSLGLDVSVLRPHFDSLILISVSSSKVSFTS